MATCNYVRIRGYITREPKISGDEEDKKIKFTVMTVHRKNKDIGHGVPEHNPFHEVIVKCGLYDHEILKDLKMFDIVDITGVFKDSRLLKKSTCPFCGSVNYKEGNKFVVFPRDIKRLGSCREQFETDITGPKSSLEKNDSEISNDCFLIGNLINDPEPIATGCRYGLKVDRLYYIKDQPDIKTDFPWVYSFGEQADTDMIYLKKGALVLVRGFLRFRRVKQDMTCENCNTAYKFTDTATELVPFSVDYLRSYKTDEEVEEEKRKKEQQDRMEALRIAFED